MAVAFVKPQNLTMSLLRILTIMAIKGRTWALDRVYDSPSTPADIRTKEQKEPFVAVYADDANLKDAASEILLLIEVAVASPLKIKGSGAAGATPEVSSINATDEAMEFQIGFMCRQVIDALSSTDEANPWASLWRDIAFDVYQTEVRRGGPGQEDGQPVQRFASRILILHCNCQMEPERGADLEEHPQWKAALAALEADGRYRGVAQLMRAHISKPTGPISSWREAQKIFGWSETAARGVGLDPVQGYDQPPPPTEEAATLARVDTPVRPVQGNPWEGFDNGE